MFGNGVLPKNGSLEPLVGIREINKRHFKNFALEVMNTNYHHWLRQSIKNYL